MRYGICHVGCAALRKEPSHDTLMTSQVLFGESFKILESRKLWSRIRLDFDSHEGWVDNLQFTEVKDIQYSNLHEKPSKISKEIYNYVISGKSGLITPIPLGSELRGLELLDYSLEDEDEDDSAQKDIMSTALKFLNCPYLEGGKTAMGIDASGFTQLVYRMHSTTLYRSAPLQSRQGDVLSFIEETKPGDLAFFDNKEGEIDHVGILMGDNYIIHVHGQVRIDRIDHLGIFNQDLGTHTHKLRVLKTLH